MKTIGIKNGKAKNLKEKEAIYSSTACKPLLLNKSLIDSKKAVKNANMKAIIEKIMLGMIEVNNYFYKIITIN
ncbi:MAG TPA: hypothetical protein VK426_00910 [Methanobacterium sp.]|nr:hypothetical protein [Methanobacterium sp.]